MGVLDRSGHILGRIASWAGVNSSRLIWVVVAAGVGLRLARYLDGRSLWLDEALLALNLISTSAGGLLESLDYVQSAPPGFLLIEKASISMLGEAEWALRLFPFLASLAGLVLFAFVARRLLQPGYAIFAVALVALAEPLLYQSAETKPYSSDLAIAVLIVWLTLRVLDASGQLRLRLVVPLAIAGVGALVLSYPSVFVVAAAASALLLATIRRRPRDELLLPVALSAVWAATFLVVYWTSADTISSVSGQIFSGAGRSDLLSLARSSWYTLADPGGFIGVPHAVAALLVVVGVVGVAVRDGRERFVLVVGPPAGALVAAFADRYPLGNRFSLFLVPFLIILVARGLEEVASFISRPTWRHVFVAATVALLIAGPTVKALDHIVDPPRGEHVRPLIERVAREWRPGDGIYVFRNSQYAFRYYGDCDGCGPAYPFELRVPDVPLTNDGMPAALVTNPPSVIVGVEGDAERETPNLELLETRERVWALFSHVSVGHDDRREDERLLAELDERGKRLGSWHEPGASLYLYRVDR